MHPDDRKLYYKIGEACRVLDIQPYVLRYWETEFPVLQPNKSRSGQRVYSERELSTIRRIKELLYDEGYTIAGAKKKLEFEGYGQEPVTGDEQPAPDAAAPQGIRGTAPESAGDSNESVGAASPRRRGRKPTSKNLALPQAPSVPVVASERSERLERSEQATSREAAHRAALTQALAEARAILRRLDESK